jgi:DeoR/GlpR family transcriptional regulator of sugar metabolism
VTKIPLRQSEILNVARTQGRVTVEDLARRFDVSAPTVRKDLNDLCERRSLTRVHGGAIIGIESGVPAPRGEGGRGDHWCGGSRWFYCGIRP